MNTSSRRFVKEDTVIGMIEENYNVIPLLSRFSIPLGVGSKTIDDVCHEMGIDTDALLLVLNYQLNRIVNVASIVNVSPGQIVNFLKNSHDYFLGYKFPHIRRNLVEALEDIHDDINPSIIKFFDDFVEKVKAHFEYEEKVVFPYIRQLVDGCPSQQYNIEIFRQHHDEVTEALIELKNIIIRYYRTSVPNKMYDVLVDIFNCEEDLESHNDIENNLLIPMVEGVESRNKRKDGNETL